MRIIFSTWAKAPYQGLVLTEDGGEHRLVSYWEARHLRKADLEEYVQNGFILNVEIEELVAALAPQTNASSRRRQKRER